MSEIIDVDPSGVWSLNSSCYGVMQEFVYVAMCSMKEWSSGEKWKLKYIELISFFFL